MGACRKLAFSSHRLLHKNRRKNANERGVFLRAIGDPAAAVFAGLDFPALPLGALKARADLKLIVLAGLGFAFPAAGAGLLPASAANGFGATTVSAWSVRARSGLGVSVPLAWEELAGLTSGDRWTASNIQTRLDKGNDPWSDYEASRQGILSAMKTLGFKP